MNEHTGGRDLPPTLASSGEETAAPGAGDLVGRILGGRYRILRKLGEGAMGAVYLGEHLKIGRQDAIKVLRDSLATDADTIARFVRGTRNVSMIRHPNICTIYDYSDTADGIQFVAMEFVPGETLRDLLQREGRLPVEVAVHIARQAAEALDAAHEVGIVHRDLKPANIMIVPGRTSVPDVKVVDFDIAKGSRDGEGEEVTRMGFVVGTPEYMSPEQLIGDRLDGRSDVYSLALVLYRMLTGTLPFAAQDTQDLMVKRLTEEPMTLAAGLPAGVFPAALEAAVRRGLQRKPAERQATAGEFGREISAAIDTRAAADSAPLLGDRGADSRSGEAAATEGGARRPISAVAKLAAGGLVLLLLTIVGVLALRDGDDEPPLASTTQLATPEAPIVEYSDPTAGSGSGESPGEVGGTEDPTQSEPPLGTNGSGTEAGPPSAPPQTRPATLTHDELLDFVTAFASNPARSTILAGRDAAVATWSNEGASAQDRATAAYVGSAALAMLGDTAQALVWIDRAIEVRPEFGGYRSFRQRLQPQGAGN